MSRRGEFSDVKGKNGPFEVNKGRAISSSFSNAES